MLVAPADPSRFDLQGVITEKPLGVPSVVVASTNDPWMPIERAVAWSDVWGAELINIGDAGHINVRAGFGPWPRGLEIYRTLRTEAEEALALAPHAPDELRFELGEL
jgi:predicted alpha/beta hydrolase family esterase